MKPVLDLAQKLDIATNPAPEALFEAGNAGFQIWCTPDDHPVPPGMRTRKGWEGIQMIAGTFSKPCEFVAAVFWKWNDDEQDPRIVSVRLETDAYALHDARSAHGGSYEPFHNRPEDVKWATAKTQWLFQQAGVPCPPIVLD